jgi:hypothetical protein
LNKGFEKFSGTVSGESKKLESMWHEALAEYPEAGNKTPPKSIFLRALLSFREYTMTTLARGNPTRMTLLLLPWGALPMAMIMDVDRGGRCTLSRWRSVHFSAS